MRNADGSGGCPRNEDDDKENFSCSNYPKDGYFALRDGDNNLVLNAEGEKTVLPLDQNKMVTFTDKEMAITACPTYASKCGPNKIFNFSNPSFNSLTDTATINISKPSESADCTDTSIDNKSVRDKCFLNTDTCTYIIKGSCLAPGFHTKSETTMTDDDVEI